MLPPLTLNAWFRWDRIRAHLGRSARHPDILEIGPGGAAVGARLATMGRYTAVERDETSRALAASRLPPETEVLRDLDELPERSQFDVVCAFEVLEHIEEDGEALQAWARRLRPGGMLLLSVPAHRRRFGPWDEAVGHHRRYDRADLMSLLEGSGLVDVRIEPTGFPLGYVLEGARNLLGRRRADREASMEARTASSGRALQPPAILGPITQIATLPFRFLQRATSRWDLGTGWVVAATRPPA